MPELEPLPLFDYASIDVATSKFLKKSAAEVKSLMRQSLENVIKTGNILIGVKARLPYGQWQAWVKAEFGWHYRTANRMMSAAENFKLADISDLDIAASAIYLLSAPSTPAEAREEAIYLAKKGLKIDETAAKDLREQHLAKLDGFKGEVRAFPEHESPTQHLLPLETIPVAQPIITPPPAALQPVEDKPVENKPTEVKGESTAKSGRRERLKKSPDQQTPALVIDKSLIKSKAKEVEAGQTWRLGGFHILFCGEPTDPRFIKRLPRDIALLLEFPPSRKLLPDSFTDPFTSHFCFSTKIKADFDLNIIREAIEITIEGTTDGGDAVALYCLPDPAIFLLIDQLECIAYCAEPDPNKCNMAIAAWTTVTKRAASRI